MAGANTLTFDEANFEIEVLNSEVPVLVDFWAEWCMPCRTLSPVIDEIAAAFQGKIKVGKLDVDANQSVALQYRVNSIPTLIFFKGGDIAERKNGEKATVNGLTSRQKIEEVINELIG